MKLLKNVLVSLFLVGSFGYLGYFFYQFSINPCDKGLKYSIGVFDNQFNVSKEDFKKYVAESEVVWEKALGRDIFVYEPEADFKINLIYDQRQLETVQKQKTEFGLSAIEDVFKKLDVDFGVFKNKYDERIYSYEKDLNLFENRKDDYENEIAFWNSKGGAPKEKFEALEKERLYLNTEATRLNKESSSINILTSELNKLLKERNIKATEYNKVAESYNQKYNQSLEFNQAEYTGKEINIYQFNNKKDLILALTHEFGHALGMDHVENAKSIMYYITGTDTETSLVLSAEDLAELNRVCKIK